MVLLFYHLSDYGIIGIGKTGETFHNAGYGKLIARITDGRYLKASFQSFDGSVKCSTITLKNNSGGSEVCSYSKDKHCLTADLYDLSFDNSLYEICAPCETAAGSCDLKLYLYADDSAGTGRKYYICYGEQHYATEAFSPMSRKNSTDSLLKKENVTPDSARNASRNYTGVCLDFSSIYAIMCREQGIPCVVLNNNKHAWNAVYLNNEWVEIDLTQDVNRCIYNKDTTDVQGTSLYCYTGFANYAVNTDTAITATSFCY